MKKKYLSYPLLDNAFSNADIQAGIDVLKSRQITMSGVTRKFEKLFAKKLNVKFALMVNSGSSANLLAAFASSSPYRKIRFKKGDEFLIPAVCWSTSLWPFVQAGLKPKFVDVNPDNLNCDANEIIKMINSKTKVIVLVHVLGLSTQVDKIRKIAKENNIILIEDTCESLGAKYKNKFLGSYGDFGTFSFYYSHQISSGEGGMITCNNIEDYNILHSLRSHGWTRGIKIKKFRNMIDDKFVFYNMGFNLRPTDVSAAIGISQFKRLQKFIKQRDLNRKKIISSLLASKNWRNQFYFQKFDNYSKPSWFGCPILIDKKFIFLKKKFLNYLKKNRIETRPIISGNFANQPSVKKFKIHTSNKKLKGAQEIEDRGFFIGLHTKAISTKELKHLEKHLLHIDKIK
jgi:CDP-6-deoxy-D-xylo-4-hexulose-3-dehydrase